MSKSDQLRPGSIDKNRSKKFSVRPKKDIDAPIAQKSVNRGKRNEKNNQEHTGDREMELDLTQHETPKDDLSWVPKRAPETLYSHDDIVRKRLAWILISIFCTVMVLGMAGIVILSVQQIDTAPFREYLDRITSLAFAVAMFTLGYYFRGKRKKHM